LLDSGAGDQTVVSPPLAPDRGQTGHPAGPPAPLDPDATGFAPLRATVADADATMLGSRPGLRSEDPGATRLGMAPPPPGASTPSTFGESASDLVGQQLGFRYKILKLLGAGGMGAVYQAWDEVLEVVVALKTIRPEVAADPETARMLERRFKQELLLARRVTHKNIVRVHDMGDVGGIKYITMPFLEGEELSAILEREGKLAVPRVMKIARSVASGLVAAHAAGVVHRDLKPANIMVDAEGEGLVMDFGVAGSTDAAKARTAGQGGAGGGVVPADVSAGETMVVAPAPGNAHGGQTMSGAVVGTVAYMAPEQARAEPVDQRADIYTLGLILYDLLLGRARASSAGSAFDELNTRMVQAPPAPRTADPSIPEALDRIIARCIQPAADARYPTIADMLADLEKLDDNGKPLPMVRRLTWRVGAAAALVVASLVGATYWLARGPGVPVVHEPVSVLIADFQNKTGDATFDKALEPMMKLALEGAGFISAYDRAGIRRTLGVRPPDKLDERAAQEIAVKQGLGVVLSGSVDRQGSRYGVSVKATQAVTGNVIASATERASSKDKVLGVATSLASKVREALGDDTSDSAKRFAMDTLSATSLEVVREYAGAMEALSRSKNSEALQGFSKAATLDPNFGLAHAGMAIASRNLDKQEDAEKYVKEAIRHLDGMTERERYRTRGMYYFLTNDYQACVKEYGDLIGRYAADAAARNNLALCLTHLRDMPRAVDEMRQVVKVLPNRALYKENLAQYLAYSGDFKTAEEQSRAMQDPGLFGVLPLAYAQMGQGQLPEAAATFESLAKIDEQGASYTASGLGDLALYEGRFLDAARIFTQGAAADVAAKDTDRAANKFAALAYTQLLRRQNVAALAAADRALANSQAAKIRFLAARVFVEAGATAKAGALSAALGAELQAEPQAYALIIDGLTALKNGNPRRAIKDLTEANGLLDTWIGHFDLGRAYLEAGAFPQADSEFDRSIKRRGEALSLFLDEEPTYGYFPPVYYYQGRVKEGLNSSKAAESYRAYLDIRGKSTEDQLLPDVRRRAAVSGTQ
jgi:serine/threonine protein kinase/Flp pilus assembly protein TadD